MSSVELRPITSENWFDCLQLFTTPEERGAWQTFCESGRFVASNVVSLSFASVSPASTPLAIYTGETMVGFLMYAPLSNEPDNDGYEIYRLMIDYRHAGNRYGQGGMQRAIDTLQALPNCRRIRTSVVPENAAARHIYDALGFLPTGEMDEDEIVLELLTP